jgi:hypothetical protein
MDSQAVLLPEGRGGGFIQRNMDVHVINSPLFPPYCSQGGYLLLLPACLLSTLRVPSDKGGLGRGVGADLRA